MSNDLTYTNHVGEAHETAGAGSHLDTTPARCGVDDARGLDWAIQALWYTFGVLALLMLILNAAVFN